jgi:CHAT domain
MDLKQAASTSFVRIEESWPAGRSRRLVERLNPTHVILRRAGPPEVYYVVRSHEAIDQLGSLPEEALTGEAFDGAGFEPAPLVDGLEDDTGAPELCLVLDEGRIVGVFDAAEMNPYDLMAGSGDESGGRMLVAELPEQIALHQEASLLVSLTTEFTPAGSLPVDQPVGSELDVVVQPRRGLSLVGTGEGRLVVSGEAVGLPLQFKVRGEELGPGLLRILAFHQGRPLGMISLAPVVTESAPAAGSASRSPMERLAPATARVPDFSLLILEARDGADTVLTLRLTSSDPALGFNLKPFGPIRLRSDPYTYFQDFFRDIERLPIRTPADKAKAELRLAAKGATLFESLLPEDLRRALWSVRARITSVQIQSEEPWIPWELCKLSGDDGGTVEEGPFFCEAFELTRWLPGLAQVPSLGLKNLALVVPSDSGLAFAVPESEFMLSLATGGRRVERIPATFLDLHAALASGTYDGWHFSGHGSYRDEPNPEKSALILEAGDRLTPEDLGGRVANLGKARPLVFLNACQVGQSQMTLTGIGGWAGRFLKAGAGGFIGAYWSVYDRPAFDFAQAFYGHLLKGVPIGRAIREARLAARASGDPTWLAYTVFADPLATVK